MAGGRFKKEIVVDGQSYLLLIRDEGGPPEAQVSTTGSPRSPLPLPLGLRVELPSRVTSELTPPKMRPDMSELTPGW